MPTCPGHQRMSPARTSSSGTSGSSDAMAPVVRGRRTPTDAHARCTSPEQSKHDGPVPPQQYRLPTWAAANRTTAEARAVVGGSRPAHARANSDERVGTGGAPAEHAVSAAATTTTRTRMAPSSRAGDREVKFLAANGNARASGRDAVFAEHGLAAEVLAEERKSALAFHPDHRDGRSQRGRRAELHGEVH